MSSSRKFAEEQARKKQEKRDKEKLARQVAEEKLKRSSVIILQCAVRRLIARKAIAELRRPLTYTEILAIRRQVFLADRKACREPGYSVSMLREKATELERARVRASRMEAEQQAHVSSLIKSIQRSKEILEHDRKKLEQFARERAVKRALELEARSSPTALKLKGLSRQHSASGTPISTSRSARSARSSPGNTARATPVSSARSFTRRCANPLGEKPSGKEPSAPLQDDALNGRQNGIAVEDGQQLAQQLKKLLSA